MNIRKLSKAFWNSQKTIAKLSEEQRENNTREKKKVMVPLNSKKKKIVIEFNKLQSISAYFEKDYLKNRLIKKHTIFKNRQINIINNLQMAFH